MKNYNNNKNNNPMHISRANNGKDIQFISNKGHSIKTKLQLKSYFSIFPSATSAEHARVIYFTKKEENERIC